MTVEFPQRTVQVRVPATSANLGPGYDTFGLALALYDEVTVEVREDPGVSVRVSGVGAGRVPTDESNLVAATILRVFAHYGVPTPGLALDCVNVIPHASGLGSSASAIVAGVSVAAGLLRGIVEVSVDDVYALATDFEGHPDNAAPAIFGGFTVSWMEEGRPRVVRPSVDPRVRAVVFVPDFESPTALARTLVPETFPKADALANIARAALFVQAISTDIDLLMSATEDRLHQPYRASIMQPSADLVAALRAAGYAAVISGAGPTVLALVEGDSAAAAAVNMASTGSSTRWDVYKLGIDGEGARVSIR